MSIPLNTTRTALDPDELLAVAIAEAELGKREGGIPIGAALFAGNGTLLGSGRNRRVQHGDPSVHGETDAFRAAGRQRDYRSTTMVTTLSPCWYCSGLVRQFNIGAIIVGESVTFTGGHEWLRANGVDVTVLRDQHCIDLMAEFIENQPELWNEDIGVAE
ncbi:nucleoside deaminase [Rhodococcus jostii]|uniref:Cytosine deaminase n=1 Tax=Rhodococcus jostii TaxID=132919 RepID=A0A1H5GS23_RHOJO|nr:nucleoside deaminase [Rhodococcus jostii]SEE18533.1 cytosine deaminase [Rhodococcus jostii]